MTTKLRDRRPPITLSEQEHYAFLHAVGCCAVTGETGRRIEVEHLPGNFYTLGKVAGGMGQKPDFIWCIPMRADLHAQKTSQRGYSDAFRSWGWPIEDEVSGPLVAALALVGFSARGDVEAARRWLQACAMERQAKRKE